MHNLIVIAGCNGSGKSTFAKFFVQMARADDLGTGILNVFHFSKLYSGEYPIFKEEDSFEVIVPLIKGKTTPKTTPKTTSKTTPKKSSKTRYKILDILEEKPTITKKRNSKKVNYF